MNERKATPILIFLVVSLGAIPPFAVDTYLSSMPLIAESFQTHLSNISITVSIFIFGMSFGQLLGGSLSDKIGRLPIIIIGLSVFSFASFMLMVTGSLYAFWAWRVVQSLGGGMASICGTALIRDNVDGKESAKLFTLVSLFMMLAPAIAPMVGTFIINFAPWQSIFAFLGMLGVLVLAISLKVLNFEKPKHQVQSESKTKVLDIFTNKRSLLLIIIQSCSNCVVLTFLTNSSFVYQEYFNTSAELFTALVAANVAVVMIINRISSWSLNHHSPEKLLSFFLTLQLLSVLTALYGIFFDAQNLPLIASALICMMGATGGIAPNCTSLFMRDYAHCSGLAASLLFSVQNVAAALTSAFIATLLIDSLIPFGSAFFIIVSIALICSIMVNKYK